MMFCSFIFHGCQDMVISSGGSSLQGINMRGCSITIAAAGLLFKHLVPGILDWPVPIFGHAKTKNVKPLAILLLFIW